MSRPSVEDVAWVFQILRDHGGRGTYRHLIYDCMGFEEEDYLPLYEAGGMNLNNLLFNARRNGH